MFEKYSEKGIKVIMLAQEEARRMGHNFVGTEQLLLGLIGEGTGSAAKSLRSLGVNLKIARIEVEKIIGRGSGFIAVEIPFTPRAKKVLSLSLEESIKLGDIYVSTEHLLLGLISEGNGVAVRVLENLDLDLELIKKNLIQEIIKRNDNPKHNNQSNENLNNDDLTIDESEIIQNLEIVGINDVKQFKNQDLFYWWQKKYIEISKSQKVNQNDLLINLNNAKEKLETFDKEYLINVIYKKSSGNNFSRREESVNPFDPENDDIENWFSDSPEWLKKTNKNKQNLSNDYIEFGNNDYDLGKYKEAIKNFDKAIKLDPFNAESFHSRGAAKDSLGNYEEAIKDYDQAILLNSNDAYFFNSRAVAKGNLGIYDEAIKDLDKGLKIDPTNKTLLENRNLIQNFIDEENFKNPNEKTSTIWKIEGDILREEKKYKKSIIYYNNAIEQENDYSNAYLCRGFSKYLLKDFLGATNDWQRSINTSKDKVDTFIQLGNFKFQNLDYSEAIEYYNKGLKINPNSKDLYCYRGYTNHTLKNYKSSFEDFEEVLRLDPKYLIHDKNKKFKDSFEFVKDKILKQKKAEDKKRAEDKSKTLDYEKQKIFHKEKESAKNWKSKGDNLKPKLDTEEIKLNTLIEAIYCYTKAIEIDSKYREKLINREEAFISRGICRYLKLDYKDAYEDFSKSISFSQKNSLAFLYRAEVQIKLNNYSDSKNDFESAFRLEKNKDIFYKRGLIRLNLRKYKQAIDDFNDAISFFPKYEDAFLLRGLTKLMLRNFNGSISDFTKLIEFNPSNHDAYFKRGTAKYELWKLGLQHFKKGAYEDFSKGFKLKPNYKNEAVKSRYGILRDIVKDKKETTKIEKDFWDKVEEYFL